MQAGDVILAHDGKPVAELRELTNAVAATPPGQKIGLEVVRDGKRYEVPVTILALPQEEPAAPHTMAPVSTQPTGVGGLRMSALSQSVRQRYGIPGQIQGVLVTGVAETSAAAELGLQPGDVIEQVNGRRVGAPKDVSAAITSAGKDGRKVVALMIYRQGQKEFIPLPVANG
jgi:serine protease Do